MPTGSATVSTTARGTNPKRVAIIGAGIGGLTAGIALTQAGHDVNVFERSPAPTDTGGALTLWPNALTALARLGLVDAVQAAGHPLRTLVIETANGRVLTRFDLGAAARRFGYPMIAIHRRDLHQVLREALGTEHVHPGHAYARSTEDRGGITVEFTNGRTVQADMLIGADGTGSVIRKRVVPKAEVRYAGYTVYRGITQAPPVGFDPQEFREYWGRGLRFAVVGIPGGQAFWGVYRNAPPREQDNPGTRQEELVRAFDGWSEEIRRLIAASDGPILRNDAVTLAELSQWTRGRTALLGDAAHAMTPNTGQGGCQAIEDAVVLARCVEEDADVERALRTYAARRRARTTKVAAAAEQYGQMVQATHPLLCGARDVFARLMPARVQEQQLRWLMRFPG